MKLSDVKLTTLCESTNKWILDRDDWITIIIDSDVDSDEINSVRDAIDNLDPRKKMISIYTVTDLDLGFSDYAVIVEVNKRAIPLLKKRLPGIMKSVLTLWPGPNEYSEDILEMN